MSAKLVPTFADRGVSRGQRTGFPRPVISVVSLIYIIVTSCYTSSTLNLVTSVGIVTAQRAGRPRNRGSIVSRSKRSYSYSQCHSVPYPVVKWPGREADRSV
jgi:hypothetical protein